MAGGRLGLLVSMWLLWCITCTVGALLPNRYEKGVINSVGRGSDPFDEEDMFLKFQIPAADSSKRGAGDGAGAGAGAGARNAEPRFNIDLDMRFPLDSADFGRADTLSAKDFAPPNSSLSAVYSHLYFEGDIDAPLRGRNAIKDTKSTWPTGRIPYVISRRFTERERAVIARAFQDYHQRTCVRFEAKNGTDFDFIYLHPGSGCASQVGRSGGMQPVSLGQGCGYVGIAEHELMHTTGFWHEQSRADRDDYVRINWENIEPGMAYNFDKYTLREIQHLEEPYDYGSVMHYGSNAFARGYGPTISPRQSGASIGQRRGLSEVDIRKINKLYECGQYKGYQTRRQLNNDNTLF